MAAGDVDRLVLAQVLHRVQLDCRIQDGHVICTARTGPCAIVVAAEVIQG